MVARRGRAPGGPDRLRGAPRPRRGRGGRAGMPATVVVALSARSRPPFLPWGVIPARGFTIRAAGSARAVVSP